MSPHLALYEQLKLLSMKDDTGLQLGYDMMNPAAFAVAGAVLMDLLVGNWIRYNSEKKCVVNNDKEKPNDAVLKAALERIAKQKKPQEAKNLILLLSVYEHPERKAITSLIAKDVVRLTKTGGFFSRKRYPLQNTALKEQIIDSLRQVLRKDVQTAPLQTLLLLRLANSAKILPYIFHAEYKNNTELLKTDIQQALSKISIDDGVDAALQEQERREEMFHALEYSLDTLTVALDAVADAVDASSGDSGGDGGGGDGGGDGGGGGGGD